MGRVISLVSTQKAATLAGLREIADEVEQIGAGVTCIVVLRWAERSASGEPENEVVAVRVAGPPLAPTHVAGVLERAKLIELGLDEEVSPQ